ncbi:hypothetical protein AB0A98_34210 [Streptomyces chrestomyceticus]|uniref:hypothetical protein n=1 Tax=Streptomyces chrestomyceticus TaxID=68185 RepID=UPI003408CE47
MCRTTGVPSSPAGFDRELIGDALALACRPDLRRTEPGRWSTARAVIHKALTSLSTYGEAYLNALPDDAPEHQEVRAFLDAVQASAGRRAVPRRVLIDSVERLVGLADAVRDADGRRPGACGPLCGHGPRSAVPGAATDA